MYNYQMVVHHANLFILSTLGGSAFDETTGAIGQEKLRTNIELVMEAYINQVNNSSCGDTQIHSTEFQEQQQSLLIFLKGNPKKEEELRKEKPALYQYFEKVWSVKRNHQVCAVPAQYLFFLVCCFGADCPHPHARVENLHVKWNGLVVVHHSRQFHFLLQTLADLEEIQILSLVVKDVPGCSYLCTRSLVCVRYVHERLLAYRVKKLYKLN